MEKNPVFQWASCPAILTLARMLALRSQDAQSFPGRMPPAASTCCPARHCGGASLGRPLSRSICGEAAPLRLARRGFGPAGEASSSSLPRCPGRVSLVASVCEKGGGLALSTGHRATRQPPPSREQGIAGENGSAFAQRITTVNYLPEIIVMEQGLAVLGAVQTRKCFCRTEKAQGVCCQWHAK